MTRALSRLVLRNTDFRVASCCATPVPRATSNLAEGHFGVTWRAWQRLIIFRSFQIYTKSCRHIWNSIISLERVTFFACFRILTLFRRRKSFELWRWEDYFTVERRMTVDTDTAATQETCCLASVMSDVIIYRSSRPSLRHHARGEDVWMILTGRGTTHYISYNQYSIHNLRERARR